MNTVHTDSLRLRMLSDEWLLELAARLSRTVRLLACSAPAVRTGYLDALAAVEAELQRRRA